MVSDMLVPSCSEHRNRWRKQQGLGVPGQEEKAEGKGAGA